MAQELKFYPNKTRLLAGGGVLAMMLVGLIIMMIKGPNPDSVFPIFASAPIVYGMGILGIGGILYLLRFVFKGVSNPRPGVALTADGVSVNGFSGQFTAGWDDFSSYTLHGAASYVLRLKDAPAFIARQPEGRPKVTAQTLTDRFGSPFLIEMGMLEGDKTQIEPFLAARLPKA